jgi:hypothetical protein
VEDLLQIAAAFLMLAEGLLREGLEDLDGLAAALTGVFVGRHTDLTAGRCKQTLQPGGQVFHSPAAI